MNGVGFVEAIVALLLAVGGSFAFIGSLGLARLPTIMERLHGPTKATTLGLGAMLIGSVVYFHGLVGTWTAHELLITVFLFITAPIAANLVAKVHLHRAHHRIDGEAPGPAGPVPDIDAGWCTTDERHVNPDGCRN